MPILAGPAAPLNSAMLQLSRSSRLEPFNGELDFGPMATSSASPVALALMQLAGLMNRFMGIIERLVVAHPKPDEDDFMRGWGEPGGDIES